MADQSPSTGRASLDSVAFVEQTLRRRRRTSSSSSSSSGSASTQSVKSFGSTTSRFAEAAQSAAGQEQAQQPGATTSWTDTAPWPDVPPPPQQPAATTDRPDDADRQPPPPRTGPSENFICRICFDGPGGDGDGEQLGRLIAPCRCKGTMKFVHTTCLSRWRVLSRRSTSSMACDQCGAAYRFKKSPFVGLATSPTLLFLVSILSFTLLIWTVGFLAELGIQRWGGAKELVGTSAAPGGGTQAVRAVLQGVGTRSSSIYDDDEDGLVDSRGGYYYSTGYGLGYGGYMPFYAEPLGYASLVKAAVREIAGGGALAKTWRFVGGTLSGTDDEAEAYEEAPSTTPESVMHPRERGSWWDGLKWEWKFGKGGVLEGQDPELNQAGAQDSRSASTASTLSADSSSDEAQVEEAASPTTPSEMESTSETRASPAAQVQAGRERAETSARGDDAADDDESAYGELGSSSWLDRLALQFSLGFSLVGVLSFLNMLASIAFLGPLHFGNLGLGRGFARLTGGAGGGRRRGAGGGAGAAGASDGATIASVLIVALVLIGVLRALHAVYKLVAKLAGRMLARLEEAIVDRYGEGDEAEDVDDATSHQRRWAPGFMRGTWDLARLKRWLTWIGRREAQPTQQRGPAAERQAQERDRWLAARAGD